MKKISLLSISLLSAFYIFAQPALTWIRPPFGTTKTYSMFAGSMTDPAVGVDQVWDYSTVTPTVLGAGVYTDPTTLPASAKNKFPTATYVEVWTSPMAPSVEQAIINYYYDCADSLIKLGQQSSGGSSSSTWGYAEGVWNMAYGASKNAQYMDPMTGKLTTGAFKYDGYGTLKTKNGVYTDVVMISFPGGKNFFQTKPYFGLLMSMLYSAPSVVAGAYINSYGASVNGLAEVISQNKYSIYAMPSNCEVVVDLADYKGNCGIKVVDLEGRLVYQNSINYNTNAYTFSVENINSGIYFVEVNYNTAIAKTKVFLTK